MGFIGVVLAEAVEAHVEWGDVVGLVPGGADNVLG